MLYRILELGCGWGREGVGWKVSILVREFNYGLYSFIEVWYLKLSLNLRFMIFGGKKVRVNFEVKVKYFINFFI